MAETARWAGHQFVVSPERIVSFSGLGITGASNTETKTKDSQDYVTRKSSKPKKITLTAELYAQVGCEVEREALALVEDAHKGTKDYLYIGGRKLFACQLMMTNANVTNVEFSPAMTWISAKVALTLEQCSKDDGAEATSSGKKTAKKKSVKKSTSTKTAGAKNTVTKSVIAGAVAGVAMLKSKATTASLKNSRLKNNIKKATSAHGGGKVGLFN